MRAVVLLWVLFHAALPVASANPAAENRVRDLSEQIEQYPAAPRLYMQRALAYSNNNQPAAALLDIERAETLGDPLEAAFVRGVLMYRAGDFGAARGALDRYLEVHPHAAAALEYRMRLARDSEDFPRALADYRRLQELDAIRAPGHHVAAADMLAAMPGGGEEEALRLLDERMAQSGPLIQLQRAAIRLERQRGNHAAALDRLGDLDERLRATPEWQLEVAEVLIDSGRYGQALPHLALAEEQLDALRPTGARQQARRRLQVLRSRAGRAGESSSQQQQAPG